MLKPSRKMQSGGELDDKREPLRKEKQLVLSLETLVDDTLGRWKAQALPKSLGCLGFAEERVGGWGGAEVTRVGQRLSRLEQKASDDPVWGQALWTRLI